MSNWIRSTLFRAEAHEKFKEMTMTPKQLAKEMNTVNLERAKKEYNE